MRKSLIILVSLVAAAVLLVVLQLIGIYSQRICAGTLAVAGVLLIAFRGAVAAWIQSKSVASPMFGHWRTVRPATIVLYGIGMLALAAASLI